EEAIRYWKRVRWPRNKKKLLREAYHRLNRRERAERAAPSGAHLGPARTDSGAAVSLQLESALGRGRHHLVELLFQALPRLWSAKIQRRSRSIGHEGVEFLRTTV